MKIATRLKFSALVPVFMALVIGLVLSLSNSLMEKGQEEGDSARQIVKSMNEINSFARHYITYHEERAKQQFLTEIDSITSFISTIRLSESNKQRIIDNIHRNCNSMREAFLKLVSNYESSGSAQNQALLREAEERLAGRILVKASEALSDAVYLNGLIHNETTATQRRISALVLFLVACTTLPFTFVLIRMMTNITKSLAKLRKGSEIVASGDLNHRIGMAIHDEIGDLSRSFDFMTEQLRDTTASRDELSREMEERKRVEEELRRSREWFGVTLGSIGDAVISTDDSGLVTFLNPIAVELTGWQSEKALGQPVQSIFRIINEKTRQPAENIVERVLREGCIINLANHTALVTLDGRQIPIEDSAAPIRDKTGNIIGVVLVFHDVSEKRRAKEALRESEIQLRTIVENLTQGVVVSDLEGRFIHWNPAALEMHGFSSMDDCLRRLPELTGTFQLSELNGAVLALDQWPLSRILRGEKLNHLELQVLCKDFEWQRIYSYGGNLAYDGDGNPLMAIVTVSDITERRRMEEELRRSHDQLEMKVRERTAELRISNKALMEHALKLERLNRELEEFAFVASHDLQEPLRKIQTFGGMLMQNYKGCLAEHAPEYLARITGSAKRMSDSIHSLLDYSRITGEPRQFEPVDLGTLAQNVVNDLESAINQAGGRIEINDLPTVEADSTQIRQLFQKLIENSIKYRKENECPVVKIHGKGSGDTCSIFIEDNGIGFEEEYLELIFRPFQQLHGRGKYEGTGMGLALCRKIVERHNGSITARSTPGQGSTFIVRLPASRERD